MTSSEQPSLSIVIEWENARLAEAERSLRMLAELARQIEEEIRATTREVEILLLHNPRAVEAAAVLSLIESVRPPAAWPARLRLEASGESSYYQQKNVGASRTT